MTIDWIVVVGAATAIAAAARSTWSPCGLSMLSSITPFGERSRRHRYGATASWFVLGAIAGGLTLGAGAAVMAAAASAVGLSAHAAAASAIAAVIALAAAGADSGAFGHWLPLVRRQVDDAWLSSYRPWFYGAGFGWQIGVGVATYIMTAAVFLVVALAALTANPLDAMAIGVLFGLARGLTVLLTSRVQSPAQLRSLHRQLARIGPAVRAIVIAVEVLVAVAALAEAWPWLATAVGTASALVAIGWALRGRVWRPGVAAAVAPSTRLAEH